MLYLAATKGNNRQLSIQQKMYLSFLCFIGHNQKHLNMLREHTNKEKWCVWLAPNIQEWGKAVGKDNCEVRYVRRVHGLSQANIERLHASICNKQNGCCFESKLLSSLCAFTENFIHYTCRLSYYLGI